MPVYTFKCLDCLTNTTMECTIKEYDAINPVCCRCGSAKLNRNYLADNIIVQDEPKTIGMLAEKNARRLR